jgi:hypothetical protein
VDAIRGNEFFKFNSSNQTYAKVHALVKHLKVDKISVSNLLLTYLLNWIILVLKTTLSSTDLKMEFYFLGIMHTGCYIALIALNEYRLSTVDYFFYPCHRQTIKVNIPLR